MKLAKLSLCATAVFMAASLGACKSIPTDALKLGPESLSMRQLQTRRFDGLAEKDALVAGAGVLQDLGYTITDSATPLGLVVGNKDRSAVRAGQVAGAVLVALLGGGAMATDKDQKIIASLVTRPVTDDKGVAIPNAFFVRVTFAHIVRNTQNVVTKAEQLNDAELYQGFFERFSKAVFLEGQNL